MHETYSKNNNIWTTMIRNQTGEWSCMHERVLHTQLWTFICKNNKFFNSEQPTSNNICITTEHRNDHLLLAAVAIARARQSLRAQLLRLRLFRIVNCRWSMNCRSYSGQAVRVAINNKRQRQQSHTTTTELKKKVFLPKLLQSLQAMNATKPTNNSK